MSGPSRPSNNVVLGAMGSHLWILELSQLHDANQRTKRTDTDGSYWDYGYDSLGQVTNAVRRWSDGAVVDGQQYGFLFDDIGNRKTSGIGVSPVQSEYTVNLLNQYSSRTVPGAFWETGSAHTGAVIKINGDTNVLRQGEYFAKALTLANTNSAVYTSLVTIAAMTYNGTNVVVTNTGSAFLPKTPELFAHDSDGSLTNDGR